MTKNQEIITAWVARDGNGKTDLHMDKPDWLNYSEVFTSYSRALLKKTHGLKPGECRRATITVVVEQGKGGE